jgi:enamine deaminase RidA (YjgF/YER057c/UK114 family)
VTGRAPGRDIVRAGDLVVAAGRPEPDGRRALEQLAARLEQAGAALEDVVDVVSYHRDAREIEPFLELARDYFPREPPAWTPTGSTGLTSPSASVALRAIAVTGTDPKQCLAGAEGPMSGACRKGSLLFVAGQSAASGDGTVAVPFDHVAQARVAYARILDLAGRAGATIDDALDFASFHHDIRGAEPTFVQVYQPEVLGDIEAENAPTTSHLGMPGLRRAGALGVYRTLFDLTGGGRVGITPDSIWWKGVLPISGGARKREGTLLVLAGQVACDSDGRVVAEGDFEGQARYILDCMREILEQAGGTLDDVVEVTSYHKEPRSWEVVAGVAEEYFRDPERPAWTAVGASSLWWEGYLHEISALAVLDGASG